MLLLIPLLLVQSMDRLTAFINGQLEESTPRWSCAKFRRKKPERGADITVPVALVLISRPIGRAKKRSNWEETAPLRISLFNEYNGPVRGQTFYRQHSAEKFTRL